MMSQALTLAKKPHIIIATPGRLVDHLENTKGFNLKALKFLVCYYLLYKECKPSIYLIYIFLQIT